MTDTQDILDHCERCGQFLVPANRVVLELKLGTDTYFELGMLAPEAVLFSGEIAQKK